MFRWRLSFSSSFSIKSSPDLLERCGQLVLQQVPLPLSKPVVEPGQGLLPPALQGKYLDPEFPREKLDHRAAKQAKYNLALAHPVPSLPRGQRSYVRATGAVPIALRAQ
jgi:hypothetical protein